MGRMGRREENKGGDGTGILVKGGQFDGLTGSLPPHPECVWTDRDN